MSGYYLTPAAEDDLDDIRKYTTAQWGRRQWLIYFQHLSRCLERAAADPTRCGRRAPALGAGIRVLTCRSHLIVWVTAPDGLALVLRVLHQRQNRS